MKSNSSQSEAAPFGRATPSVFRKVCMAVLAGTCIAPLTRAADQYFDSAISGTTWTTTNANWANTSGGAYEELWVNGNIANFEGDAATILLGPGLIASGITFNNVNNGTWRLDGELTLSGTNGQPVIFTGTGNNTPRIHANLTAVDGFIKTGSRDLALRGDQSGISGTVNVSEGTLYLQTLTAGSANATWSVASGATLRTQNSAGTYHLGALTGAAGSTLNSSGVAVDFQIGALNTSTTFAGSITNGSGGGTMGIEKVGTGTLTLTGNSIYTRDTIINGGTLRVDGSLGDTAVAVNASGTLAGSGSIAGSVTVNSGGTISAGNSPGTLTTGSQIWEGGGINLWEINDATGTAGEDSGWDLLSITGSLVINADSASKFTIRITSLSLTNEAGDAANFDPNQNYAFLMVDSTSEIDTFDPSAFLVDTSAFSNSFTGFWSVTRGDTVGGDNTQLYITYTIPEPSMPMLMGLAGGITLLRRKRRVNS
jgi:autotransporter-associated beta strand protein